MMLFYPKILSCMFGDLDEKSSRAVNWSPPFEPFELDKLAGKWEPDEQGKSICAVTVKC